jgi:hypothetical protein
MKWVEYLASVRHFCNPKAFLPAHFIEGLAEEAAEILGIFKKRHYDVAINRTDLLMELGDFAWFVSLFFAWYATMKGTDEKSFLEDHISPHYWIGINPALGNPIGMVHELYHRSGFCLMKLDRYEDIGSSKNLKEMFDSVVRSLAVANRIVGELGFTWEEIWKLNHTKLDTRYEGNFTQKAAIDRDVEAERRAVEAAKAP